MQRIIPVLTHTDAIAQGYVFGKKNALKIKKTQLDAFNTCSNADCFYGFFIKLPLRENREFILN